MPCTIIDASCSNPLRSAIGSASSVRRQDSNISSCSNPPAGSQPGLAAATGRPSGDMGLGACLGRWIGTVASWLFKFTVANGCPKEVAARHRSPAPDLNTDAAIIAMGPIIEKAALLCPVASWQGGSEKKRFHAD
eukprot:scaffold164625_cov16-Tisochrysis_lutea.AAC.1